MGNYEQLKQAVSDVIKTNGNQEITGSILQSTLLSIISTVGANATFAGIATPTTNPGTPDGPVFYLAPEGGAYTNFNAIELQDGLSVLMWNGSWSSQQIFGVDDVPTAGSDNLVKSGGVYEGVNRLEAIVLGKSEFSIKGKVYINGVLTTRNDINSTELIALDGISILSFSLFLSNIGQVVSFFDEDRVFISSISIDGVSDGAGGGAIVAKTLYLKNTTYADAKYVAFSNYAPVTSSFYKLVTESSFLNNLISIKAADFGISDKIYNNGVLIPSSDTKSTHLIDVDGITGIDYCLRLNQIGDIISFFDERENFISGIKASDSELATKIGTIKFENTNIKYVAFSCWNPTNEHYIKINNTIGECIKDLEAVKCLLGIPIDMYANAGSYYVNGVLKTADADAYSSRIIDISFAKLIRYRLRLNNTAQIISFFDSNLDYLSSISITASEAQAQTIEGVIDMSDAKYADARFVAFSCWKYNDTFYVELGSSNDYYSQIKQLQNERPFLVGRKFCALGDSITDGVGNSSYSWYDMLLKRYNSEPNSLDFAETGQCLRTMADLCTEQNMAGVDFCFVMGGTNQLSNYRLGTINDDATPDRWQPNKAYSVGDKVLGGTMEEHGWTTHIKAYLYWYECMVAGTSGNTADASEFSTTLNDEFTDGTVTWKCIGNPSWYSDMKGICRRVWGFNPKIQIIWIVPIKTKNDADVLNPELWARAEKFQAIRDFCNGNSIRFIDLQKEFPLNTYTKNAIMADNLHPNDNGYRIIQDIVCSHIG